MSKTALVVAHHHPNLDFLNEWKPYLDDVHVVICRDRPEYKYKAWDNMTIYDHEDINKDLGKNAWIISVFNSAIKSYGFYKAYQSGFETIVAVDNDCFPTNNFFKIHQKALDTPATLGWIQTAGFFTRGFPYLIRGKSETVLNHGTWSNIPDIDAPTQLLNPDFRSEEALVSEVIPKNNFFPMSGMNIAFKKEVTPLMYFGLQGDKYPYNRFDDVWAGIFAKKVIDHLGLAVRSGIPSVEHRRQSNVFENLQREASGLALNEVLYKEVEAIRLTKTSIVDSYKELIAQLPDINDYIKQLKKATLIWLSLYEN